MTHWAILTGEYPPQPGGVSDYTRLVARGLASAGDRVTVYAPPHLLGPDQADAGVMIRRLPDTYGIRAIARLDRELATLRDRPDCMLIQYVPHAFGLRAMNLFFPLWLVVRKGKLPPVWVMFHEVAFPFSWRPRRHAVLGIATALMARLVCNAAQRVLISIPAWAQILERLVGRKVAAEWMPVPCCVSTSAQVQEVSRVRATYKSGNGFLIGHFGTYGAHISSLLGPAVVSLLELCPNANLLLIGKGSLAFLSKLVTEYPALDSRVFATGQVSDVDVSTHLRACDVLVQPYVDGVSSRRTSVMAGLANGVPVVTNLGFLSESIWASTKGVCVVGAPDPISIAQAARRILGLQASERYAMGALGKELYNAGFSLRHTLSCLRNANLGRS